MAAIEQNVGKTIETWKAQQWNQITILGSTLYRDPPRIVEQLASSAFGIDWLLGEWRGLAAVIEDPDTRFLPDHAQKFVRLLGHDSHKVKLRDVVPPQSAGSDPSPEALLAFIATVTADLASKREQRFEEVERPLLRQALAVARVDTTPEAVLMQRYEASLDSQFYRASRPSPSSAARARTPRPPRRSTPTRSIPPREPRPAPEAVQPEAPSKPRPAPETDPSPAAANPTTIL